MTLSSNSGPHQPVLVAEVIGHLITNPDGAYVDGTVGSGGYLKALSAAVGPGARLYGVDLDREAVARSRSNLSGCRQRCRIVQGNYADLAELIIDFPDRAYDGILLDLGLSSEQLDDSARGFAHRIEGPLDMRFRQEDQVPTAARLLNELDQASLARIILEFGEERAANRIAGEIVKERQKRMIRTTADLSSIVAAVVPARYRNKSLSRVFQALRIHTNRELASLQRALPILPDLLNPGGRLAVISYHSLEDRLVKRFFARMEQPCECPPGLPVCVCGCKPTLKRITKKAITPGPVEIESNPRSRSARLRVAEKLGI
jgi:16S rRNA (cytosine1402-N4)-methyltransferase